MRIALIARMDNSGLGTLSWEFARHLKPAKILLVSNGVHQTFPNRYADFDTKTFRNYEDFQWLLTDVDVLFSIETFYDWSVVKLARQKGVKTVLYTMYEMSPDPIPLHPDLYLCPSKLDVEYFKNWNHVYLPTPLADDRLQWKQHRIAHTFMHTASHGGMSGRKGTQLFIDAMQYVKSDVKFLINSWKPIGVSDKRAEVRVVNYKNYWQAWQEGDVLVYPQDYNGICLPIVEAMACGLGVITTDIFPFNEYMPKRGLFKPESMYRTRAAPKLQETEAAKINPLTIAEKIDELANADILDMSLYGKEYARKHSWKKLLPDYLKVFKTLCGQ